MASREGSKDEGKDTEMMFEIRKLEKYFGPLQQSYRHM
jgi:hypothetical protein